MVHGDDWEPLAYQRQVRFEEDLEPLGVELCYMSPRQNASARVFYSKLAFRRPSKPEVRAF
jgi:hypothetical protein